MKQTSSFPRRTAFAIAAASAGLTLAVVATLASSLGLIAPATGVSAPSTGWEQPAQEPPAPLLSDGLASAAPATVNQSATREAAPAFADSRPTRRERDDEHRDRDDTRGERVRSASSGDDARRLGASTVVSRARHQEDDDD